jgi:hypothetical protein
MKHPLLKLYPRANENRTHGADPSIRGPRKKLLKAAALNFLYLQVLFLGLFSYLFGSLFQQNSHVHNLGVLFVDYDGGIIGNSLRDAYSTLKGDGFPTLIERPASAFPAASGLREEVCEVNYWAALYVLPGASGRLEDALSGSSTYNNSDVMSFIWNEARYSATTDSLIVQNMQTLSSTARTVYVSNETEARKVLSANNTAAISAFANPWQLVSQDIMPTTQGSRLIYNTLVIILILIQEFFYLGTINGLYVRFNIYARLFPHRIIIYRIIISASYTLVGSLCTAGAIWAFREGWAVNANQFALTWAILWLFAHANFLTFDVFTVWLPAFVVPMAMITWVVFNVTSILLPFELIPRFYRWSYAMPANAAYRTLTDIWSKGCNPQLRYSLPILFTLEIVSLSLSSLGVYRRCHYALLGQKEQEKSFHERVDIALKFERSREKEIRTEERLSMTNRGARPGQDADAEERHEDSLASMIRQEDAKIKREQTRTNTSAHFGPCFDVAFSNQSDDSVDEK